MPVGHGKLEVDKQTGGRLFASRTFGGSVIPERARPEAKTAPMQAVVTSSRLWWAWVLRLHARGEGGKKGGEREWREEWEQQGRAHMGDWCFANTRSCPSLLPYPHTYACTHTHTHTPEAPGAEGTKGHAAGRQQAHPELRDSA